MGLYTIQYTAGALKLWTSTFSMYFGVSKLDFGDQIWKFMFRFLNYYVCKILFIKVQTHVTNSSGIKLTTGRPLLGYFSFMSKIFQVSSSLILDNS